MRNKLMAVCYLFVVGVVLASLIPVQVKLIPTLYIICGILFALAVVLGIAKKKFGLFLPGYIIFIIFIIAFMLLGFTHYSKSNLVKSKNHMSEYVAEGFGREKMEIEGIIVGDPDVFEDKTRIIIRPYTFKWVNSDDDPIKISGGNIMMQVKKAGFFGKENEDWYKVSKSSMFGARIIIRGRVIKPSPARNPGTFDYAKFMTSENIAGVLWFGKIKIVHDENGNIVKEEVVGKLTDAFINFSLGIKTRMLRVYRQTMPFPESAFLGGVTLGLKRGLTGKPCVFNDYYKAHKLSLLLNDRKAAVGGDARTIDFIMEDKDIQNQLLEIGLDMETIENEEEYLADKGRAMDVMDLWAKKYDPKKQGCDKMIEDEFRWAGVSNVLAVSGLHVSIIAVMLFGIFSAFKIPKKVFAPITVFALVVFLIITGGRPSTMRAVIMNSLTLLTFVYGGRGLRSSLMFSISVAALIILLLNPLLIYAPSFTLSFGALLSLGLITTPVEFYLRKLKGIPFWFTIVFVIALTLFANTQFFLFKTATSLISLTIFYFVVLYFLTKMDRNYPLFGSFGFGNIPMWLRGFIGAQFAIQIGMMIPLSSFYFGQFPLAGAYANFLAIPLIGIIVQLGMIAGLLGMIPYVGLYIALLLNATNWIFCKFFLYISHYSTVWFNFPAIPKVSVAQVIFFYLCVGVFIWHMKLIASLKKLFFTFNIFTESTSQNKIKWALIGLLVIFLLIGVVVVTPSYHNKFKVTTLDVGFNGASVVELPDGTFWLVDGAFNKISEYRQPFKRWDNGLKTVVSFLSQGEKRIMRLDGVILTSLEKEHITGMATVLEHIQVDKIYDQLDPENIDYPMERDAFFDAIGNEYLKNKANEPRGWWAREYYDNYMAYLKQIKKQGTERFQAKDGVTLYENEYKGNKITITCFSPPAERPFRRINENSVVVKFKYGKYSITFTGDIGTAAISRLSNYSNPDSLKTDVLIFPNHGYVELGRRSKEKVEDVIQKVLKIFNPSYVIVQTGNAKNILNRSKARAAKKQIAELRDIIECEGDIKYFNTNDDYAILTESDGHSLTVNSFKKLQLGIVEKPKIKKEEADEEEVSEEDKEVKTELEF